MVACHHAENVYPLGGGASLVTAVTTVTANWALLHKNRFEDDEMIHGLFHAF